jgi:hypothetical protein
VQQLQRHAGSPQLDVDVVRIRLDAQDGSRRRRWVHAPLELDLVELLGLRPPDPRRSGPPGGLRHRAQAHPHAGRRPARAQALVPA